MDVYRHVCGLLGQEAVSEQQLAKAVGQDVSSVRALRRDEYTTGTPLPEKLDDNFISREIVREVERIREERAKEVWVQAAERLQEADERKKEGEKAETREHDQKARAKERSQEQDDYFTDEALREEMRLAGQTPPSVELIVEGLKRKRELEEAARKREERKAGPKER